MQSSTSGEFAVHGRVGGAQRDKALARPFHHRLGGHGQGAWGGPAERLLAGQQFVKDHAEGEEVRPSVGRLTGVPAGRGAQPLRGHVGGRTAEPGADARASSDRLKSSRSAWPAGPSSTLDGLRSRWTTPSRWRKANASAISSARRATASA